MAVWELVAGLDKPHGDSESESLKRDIPQRTLKLSPSPHLEVHRFHDPSAWSQEQLYAGTKPCG